MKKKVNSNDIRPEDRDIGDRLAAARSAANLSQTQVAEKAGWFKDEFGTPHQQRVSHYETGRRRITLIDFLEYASAINVNPAKILDLRAIEAERKENPKKD